MRLTHVTLPAACLVVLLACGKSEEAAPPAAPEAAAPDVTATAPQVAAANHGHDYACGDGLAFNARIDKGNALVTLEGKTLTLAPIQGATSAQYAGEGVTFIARGNEAVLVREGEPLRNCTAK